MKSISFFIGCFILISFGFISYRTKVKITNKSEVIIKGKSNVNSFECKYNTDFIEDEFQISLSKQNAKILFSGAKTSIRSNGFDCAHRIITKDFKTILKADEYSHIKLELKEIITSNECITAKIKVGIAGVSKEYNIPVDYDSNNNNVKGNLKINIVDFNLKAPRKLLGVITVDDDVEIDFNLFLQY